MRHIHPLAWIGLFLNIALCLFLSAALDDPNFFLWATQHNADFLLLSPEEQARVRTIMTQTLIQWKTMLYILFAVQALALWLIVSGFRAGLPLAIIGAFLMLPAGALYMVGCAFSYYNRKYEAFETAPADDAKARAIFRSATAPWVRTCAMPLLASSLFALLVLGSAPMAALLLVLALVALYSAARMKKNHPLSLHDRYFTMTTNPFAPNVKILYSAVQMATLFDDERIQFKVMTSLGVRALTWSLRYVEKIHRRQALEGLSSMLTAHQVPLH